MNRKKKKVPATLTITDHQQLADHCMALLDEVAAIISRLSETRHTRASTATGHLNIPTVFLGSVVTSVELIPQLQNIQLLDVAQGRETLQLMEAFRPVRDKVTALDRNLVHVINARRSSLVRKALHTYAVAKSLAVDHNNVSLLACVRNMQRALGRRGRPRKT